VFIEVLCCHKHEVVRLIPMYMWTSALDRSPVLAVVSYIQSCPLHLADHPIPLLGREFVCTYVTSLPSIEAFVNSLVAFGTGSLAQRATELRFELEFNSFESVIH